MSEPPIKKPKFQLKKRHFQSKKRQYLETGFKGFLATCNFDEKNCVRECYNILNQYADELYGAENCSSSTENPNDEQLQKNAEDPTNDIADELQMQINATQSNCNTKRRFQVVDTGATNCIFIKTTLDDPQAIVTSIVNDIADTKQQKTRHLLRLLPIEVVCKANEKDIVDAAGKLCDKFFLKDHTTFSIVFNKRFNNDMNRDRLIHEIANLIHSKNPNNKVDLKHAKRSLIIEVIKGLCCLTVVNDYMANKKYNLVELSKSKDDNSCKPNEEEKIGKEEASEPEEKEVK